MSAEILLVGFGLRGRQWQAAVRRARHRLAGVVDPAPTAREAARRLGAPTWESIDEALAEARPTLAIVATPADLHADHAEACLGGGCPVLVEKPLAHSLEGARRIAEAADRARLPALVAHNFRFRPLERAVRGVLERGTLGELEAGVMVSAHPASTAAGLGTHAPLWDFAIHHLDLWRDRLGVDPDSIEAELDGARRDYLLRLAYPGGPRVTYRHRAGAPAFHWYEWLEGDSAALRVELDRVRLHSPHHRPRRVRLPRVPSAEAALLDHALAAARSGDAGTLAAQANLGTIALLERACATLSQERKARV
jgi:predicted dehydrogenase